MLFMKVSLNCLIELVLRLVIHILYFVILNDHKYNENEVTVFKNISKKVYISLITDTQKHFIKIRITITEKFMNIFTVKITSTQLI